LKIIYSWIRIIYQVSDILTVQLHFAESHFAEPRFAEMGFRFIGT
jgi:hypothetical protein